MRFLSLIVLLLGLSIAPASAQMARNPKISAPDLAAAQAETSLAGGAAAELIYAARLDVIQKGAFDSLIVIYSKPAKNGKDYHAVILREAQKLPLALDKQGRALKPGDKFLRMGLKHEEGKPPILRLIGATTDPAKGDQQRNLDYRFDGTAFVLEAQSLMPLAK
ncbi:MAG: hypothetical protein ACKVX9_13220 [Blastocatellia bacterium]